MPRKTDFEILLSIRAKLESVVKSMKANHANSAILTNLNNTRDDVGILLSRHTPPSRTGPKAVPFIMPR